QALREVGHEAGRLGPLRDQRGLLGRHHGGDEGPRHSARARERERRRGLARPPDRLLGGARDGDAAARAAAAEPQEGHRNPVHRRRRSGRDGRGAGLAMSTKSLVIGVIGTGTMGCGIAQVAAQCGYPVLFQNRKQDSVDKGLSKIDKSLSGLAAKGKLSAAQVEAIQENIRGVVPLEELKACDIVLESAPEDLELKRDLFQKLDGILGDDAILASNTSSLSITKLASFTKRPGHVVGMHFFNPVPAMKLVEIVAGLNTADSTLARVRTLAEDLGKVPV